MTFLSSFQILLDINPTIAHSNRYFNGTMDQFLLDHAERHQTLVGRFKPPRQKVIEDNGMATNRTNPNIVVATRIRPILDEEKSVGQVVATFPREGESGVVDLHELRRVVRGFPPLNVST
jgi:kinesin family protein 2/24